MVASIAHGAQEFLEEHCVVSTRITEGLPPTLQKYPDLLDHIKAILSTHGAAAAQGRRRDDKAYIIGVSLAKIRDILKSEYDEEVSEATIWRMFRTSRTTCVRTVRAGGRYNLIDSSTTVVKNSQFVSDHVRGHWCASRIRVAMELAADLHSQGHKVAWWAIDNMARIPLIVDATSQVYARNRGHTMRGDGRNFYDHHIAVGRKMLMEVTGIFMCYGTDGVPIKDQFDRQRLPRPRAIQMEVFLRGVPDLPSGCTQRLHWDDIESA